MAQVCLARVIPSMHVHLCVVLWLFSSPVSFSSSFRCSYSGPSRCLPPSSTRGSSPKTCATSAWGPWPLLTTRHPSQPLNHFSLSCSPCQEKHKYSNPQLSLSRTALGTCFVYTSAWFSSPAIFCVPSACSDLTF